MSLVKYKKAKRHIILQKELERNPFLSDEELSALLGVSVSTIRLDRTELGIPELRERTRAVAHEVYGQIKTLGEQEIIGNLRELLIGEAGTSELLIEENMVLAKSRVARGHHLFAQANSLAMALVDAEVALTGSVELKFVRPAHLGEHVLAEGKVLKRKDNKYWIEITARVNNERVFSGKWVLFALEEVNPEKGAGK